MAVMDISDVIFYVLFYFIISFFFYLTLLFKKNSDRLKDIYKDIINPSPFFSQKSHNFSYNSIFQSNVDVFNLSNVFHTFAMHAIPYKFNFGCLTFLLFFVVVCPLSNYPECSHQHKLFH